MAWRRLLPAIAGAASVILALCATPYLGQAFSASDAPEGAPVLPCHLDVGFVQQGGGAQVGNRSLPGQFAVCQPP